MHATESQTTGLAVLIGEWTTLGAHPMLPGKTFHGRATFTWLESGAFLLFQSQVDEPDIPDGVAILGTDDAIPDAGAMLYYDVRNVSREYRWTISDNVWTWSRDDARLFAAYGVHYCGRRPEHRGKRSDVAE